jgi:hypothetical protein
MAEVEVELELVVVVAGLELVVGAFGAAVGLWAKATEAVAQSTANVVSKYVGLMEGDCVETGREASSFGFDLAAAFLLL